MNGSEPRVQPQATSRRRVLWIAGAVLAAAVVAGIVYLVSQGVPTVEIEPLTDPIPGGDTCGADPFELTGIFPGGEVAFTNHTNSTVKITDDTGLFTEAPPPLLPGATKRLKVKPDAAAGKHWYSLSCVPSAIGEGRPRIVVRSQYGG